MNYETLQFKNEGLVGVLTINRPQALNALNSQLLEELKHFLSHLDHDLRVLIVTGSGEKAFAAGADIKEMDSIDNQQACAFSEKGQRILQMLEDLPVPTIAAVNGYALGGGLELALACDFIVAADSAKLGLPEVSLGLIPGYGGTQRLSRSCGRGVAKLMTFSGDSYSALQCFNWGVVSMVVPAAELLPTCLKLAGKIAQRSPRALGLAKKAIVEGVELTLDQGLKVEAQYFAESFSSLDKSEGVRAFIEKRQPKFTGK